MSEDRCVCSLLEGCRERQIIIRKFLGGSVWVPQKAELVRRNEVWRDSTLTFNSMDFLSSDSLRKTGFSPEFFDNSSFSPQTSKSQALYSLPPALEDSGSPHVPDHSLVQITIVAHLDLCN